MKGTTNALVYRGGGTSLIYAYNGEESGWSAGEKAYISNRLRTQEGRQNKETPSKTYSACTAFYGKTMLIYSRYSTGHIYPAFCKNGAFAIGGSLGHFASMDILANYSFIDGRMFACGRGTNTRLVLSVREVHLSAKESDFYLGGGMRLYKEQGSAPVLQEFDYEAQRAGSTLYTFTGLAETAYRGIYDSEAKRLLLFPGVSAGTSYLYDLAVPTSPVLLWSGNIGVFAVMATDLRPGAVIFCSPSAETNMDTGGGVQWQTFTIDENDAVVPLDMPANLATLSVNAWWLYNPNNKSLSIGTADGIYLFAADREGKLFTPIKTAAELAEKEVHVIHTKNVAMGIAAAVAFQDDVSGEENAKRMAEAAEHVKTGTVTYAVRDSEYNGVQIHKGDIIGMHNGKIEYCGNSVHDVVMDMMKAVVTDDAELITVYYGADTTKEDAEQVAAEIAEQYPNCDVDCLLGGQPLYYYLISVE